MRMWGLLICNTRESSRKKGRKCATLSVHHRAWVCLVRQWWISAYTNEGKEISGRLQTWKLLLFSDCNSSKFKAVKTKYIMDIKISKFCILLEDWDLRQLFTFSLFLTSFSFFVPKFLPWKSTWSHYLTLCGACEEDVSNMEKYHACGWMSGWIRWE